MGSICLCDPSAIKNHTQSHYLTLIFSRGPLIEAAKIACLSKRVILAYTKKHRRVNLCFLRTQTPYVQVGSQGT